MRKYLYKKEKNYELYKGKMQDVLSTFNHNSIDCVITDPPYELNFMNKGWDNSGVAFQKETWEHCYKVLKPGGYLLAFGGTRTFHRIACAIEDAGFEIRDTIMWLYGSGFPKSTNIGLIIDKKLGLQEQRGKGGFQAYGGILGQETRKAKLYKSGETVASAYTDYKSKLAKLWGGWGTQLKPAYEPVIVARKPFKGSLVDNVLEYGVGGLNIDECRVKTEEVLVHGGALKKMTGDERNGKSLGMFQEGTENKFVQNENGRFPANVILTYDDTDFDEVCGGFPYTNSTGGKGEATANTAMFFGNGNNGKLRANAGGFGDSDSASRYFYCAKASKKDRDEGLDAFESKQMYSKESGNQFGYGNTNEDNFGDRIANVVRKNIHPTVKPVELMQYLVRLVAPKGGTILDCFMGSGSTGKAVMFENRERNANYKFIGVEMTDEYLPICESRIDYALNKYEYEEQKDKEQRKKNGTPNIFDFLED